MKGEFKTNRGSAWFSYDKRCRATFRNANRPGIRDPHSGFRLVAKAKPQFKLLHSGSWYSLGEHCRAAICIVVRPGYHDPHFGLRLVAKEKKDEG